MPKHPSPHATSEIMRTLDEDHDKILALFDEFERIRHHADDETLQTLVETACTELIIHAQVEEEFFYPALMEALGSTDPIEEALVEHNVARQLIGELESMQPGDHCYSARFHVLGQYVRHHIDEERRRIFPQLPGAELDAGALAADLRHRRDALRGEFGLPDSGYEEEFGQRKGQLNSLLRH
ncbi:hemerythrin domain-containing protein [Lacisediminimonas sp.]|uniref:hemerythrin domain-containing protein n=1 Tax=Lacisediminimonas sp. TaxID=3060582 RepID=UPI00271A669F|nr:hemerythrin domain-containing protein [Lacisediminimonas sp.]MDO8299592.1 hemerythrin domain-containing protein [Lacisediminimonas sp.]MDO9218088.1 hemerythrin domain-containing protein [Lacisediminimonas sp.]